jgi:hypothetical protein
MTIRALRILPPFAIARLGSSPEPLENYDVRVVEDDPLGFRQIHGAETLVVDRRNGTISRSYTPKSIRFKDGRGRVKPVAPFLEVWAEVNGALVPLTTTLLAENKLTIDDIEWRAQVGNHKAFRRTNKPPDRIDANTGWFRGHGIHPLTGTCENFLAGRTIPFGDVQFIRPDRKFPGIRLRFTPAKGLIYGAVARHREADLAKVDGVVYDSSRGTWSGYSDGDVVPSSLTTSPSPIYANLDDDRSTSRGYLDDECDGIVEVRIEKEGKTVLQAFARIGAGPPDFAPDTFPVRTIADDLEQALLGPNPDNDEVSSEWTEEIIRRAFETVRLQNTAALNGNPIDGSVVNSMVSQDTNWGRAETPIMAPAIVDSPALQALHQSVFAAIRSGSATWFGQVLRKYDDVGDLTDRGRRKMPAMMRGSDGMHLALTRRQYNAVLGSGNQQATSVNAKDATFTIPTTPPGKETE